ncbi:hypothetical protein BC938DRAFT_479205 [Jimgerdemannia flammicorona]|nr:hypothetical protein BC938DRAFT_479205 [Jimgerdemannia flammicorona]
MHDESAANDWLFFYVLSGRYDAITIRNAVGEVPLCVSHIRDAIYARISKVLKHMDVIQIRLIDPITEHEFFVGAPIEHLLFKWDESYEKAGGKPRPRIGSQQRPLKVIVDEELAKIWEGAMKREE